MRRHPSKLLPLLAALAAACGGSSSGGAGTMNVHLVDGPNPSYAHVLLDVREVGIHGPNGWVVLGKPAKVIDLLALTGGVEETLANGASLPEGHYDQMRLLLGSQNSIVLADGTTAALMVPSGMQSGVKLNVSFDVAPGTTKDVFIDFDAHRSVFVHEAGNSGKYLLRPVVRAVDAVVTGSVAGHLTDDAATPHPLAGVTVTAQVVGAGLPDVVRTTTTAADGSYRLDLLPVGATYYVVAQPVTSTSVYAARASAGVALTAAAPTANVDLAFTAAATSATVSGTIAPPLGAEESDLVSLVQPLDVGAGVTKPFIVREAAGAFDGTSETYTLSGVPAGAYTGYVTRQSIDASGNPVSTTSAGAPAIVVAPSTTLDLTAP